jgi:hypothetical protein
VADAASHHHGRVGVQVQVVHLIGQISYEQVVRTGYMALVVLVGLPYIQYLVMLAILAKFLRGNRAGLLNGRAGRSPFAEAAAESARSILDTALSGRLRDPVEAAAALVGVLPVPLAPLRCLARMA